MAKEPATILNALAQGIWPNGFGPADARVAIVDARVKDCIVPS